MIKTETIKVPESVIKEHMKEVVTYFCDFCPYKTNMKGMVLKCDLCERHACQAGPKHCARFDHSEFGDYPPTLCPSCYALKFGKYKEQFEKLEEDYYNAREALKNQLIKDSLVEERE